MEGQSKAQASASSSDVNYKPAENPSTLENFGEDVEVRNVGECEIVPQMDDSQLVGVPIVVAGSSDVDVGGGDGDQLGKMEIAIEVKVEEESVVKRKRGRPPRAQAKTQVKPAPKKNITNDEEDVCFICFDGGNLVLCDRRGCPKAYHPACIKRDESFFRSKAKWNCGWHICSNCEKASHYMCYTCTYSLCKGCIKEADILCIRGNKGFCTTCMRTVMLIEKSVQGNKDTIQVDFDDQSSWEYLFKVYWIYLKTKLSLTSNELGKAKNPWKGVTLMTHKSESSDELYVGNDDKGSSSDSFSGCPEANTPSRKKTKKPRIHSKEETTTVEKTCNEKALSLPKGAEWASKELLEFVAHMKNGDTSVLSQFDAQALLLEYIKRNNLRDPRRKSQIICDLRLGNMFGKARVGHFEMLKLLELHFLNKEDSHADNIIPRGFIAPIASQFEVDRDNQMMMGKDKRRKARKKGNDRGRQTNLDEYAAIDFHNINLIYLRRSLMESLIEDSEKFHDKVFGSVVRIRISSSDQKQDLYRLVQVVGTSKVEPYKVGQRTAYVMLEILNLHKKEIISIDEISNQEFSKDECRRLRQSIKCGLVKRFTVGEILEKAVALQAVRVNDWLEAETLRLNHLRDRASEKGHRKELRECVEKLQLLNTPEERQRRQLEIPEVHADPCMDPSYESDDAGESDHKKQDENMGSRYSGLRDKGRKPISRQRGGAILKDNKSSARKNLATSSERKRNMSTKLYPSKEGATGAKEGENGSLRYSGRDAYGSNNLEKPRILVDPAGPATGARNNQAVVRSDSGVASETSTVPFSADSAPSADNSEMDKMWHYQDPSGNNQGPFSMLQLRKWSTSGYFPPDLRIWRINEKQDGVLLTDAMNGHYHKEPLVIDNSYDATAYSSKNNEFVRATFSANSSPADINSREVQAAKLLQSLELKDNEFWSDPSHMHSSLPSPTFSGKPSGTTSHQGREDHGSERWNSGQNSRHCDPDRTAEFQSSSGLADEKSCNSQNNLEDWKPPPTNSSSNNCNINSGFASIAKSTEMPEQNCEVDFQNLPSPTPKPSNEVEECKDQVAENKQDVSSNVLIPDSDPSWSSPSSPLDGGAQLPGVVGEWSGYSPTPVKPSVEEWDSSTISRSSLKPIEVSGDLAAAPTSKHDQLILSSPSHPASDITNWQAIVTGPNEFPLAEESVSDLLAEVDAMECLNGPPSPTSAMNSIVELGKVSKDECFSSVEGLSPILDPGKSDAISSTTDVLMSCHSVRPDGPNAAIHADVLNPKKRYREHSCDSAEVEGETEPSEVSVHQWEADSDFQPPASSSASWDMPATDTSWRGGPETTDTGWGPALRNANLGWPGPVQININMGWGSEQVNPPGNANINWGGVSGNLSMWVGQPKYGGERFPGQSPRDRGFQGGGPGYGRDRSSWNRQSSFGGGGGGGSVGSVGSGGGGGGGSFRLPPKGQRVCKFYESGRCKKGAFCAYLHP